MRTEPILDDEEGRLKALERLGIFGTPGEEMFDSLVRLAKKVLSVPICAITIVDRDRQWFKARAGIDAAETPREGALCSVAVDAPDPLVVENAARDPRFADNPLVAAEGGVRAYAGVGLTLPDGFRIGTLCVMDTRPRVFTADEIDTLEQFAHLVVEALEQRQIATIDELTGALTRRAWRDRLQREIERSARYRRPVSILMFDLDHFKRVNDVHGHAAGDTVLKAFARLVQDSIRASDQFGRVGGEEFALLMPETRLASAAIVAERIRSAFAARPIEIGIGVSVPVTVSIGAAELRGSGETCPDLMARADVALYRAKATGRDRVVPQPKTARPTLRLVR